MSKVLQLFIFYRLIVQPNITKVIFKKFSCRLRVRNTLYLLNQLVYLLVYLKPESLAGDRNRCQTMNFVVAEAIDLSK